ncbi:alpha/beta fold hydrolase [Streptomyces bauhiniae]
MRDAAVTAAGDRIRWVELPGSDAPRVYLHGLGATAAAYFAEAATHPLIAGHRTLLVDLLGHGLSDRPRDFDYSLQSHAGALAAALTDAGVTGAEVIAHGMGGAVAIVLADRHPELVSRLVLVDAGLDPVEPVRGALGSAGIAACSETEFVDGGWEEIRDRAGASWRATMRLTDPTALHRSATGLARGTVPTMRELLVRSEIPRTFLHPEADGPLPGEDGLREAGVSVVAVADCGHDVMLDAPEAFASLVAAALAA